MDTERKLEELGRDLVNLGGSIDQLSKKLERDSDTIQECRRKIESLEVQYKDSLRPDLENIKSVILPLQNKISELANNLSQTGFKIVQCLDYVNKMDSKQDELNKQLGAVRELIYEVRQLNKDVNELKEAHDEDIDKINEKLTELEKTADEHGKKIDTVYLSKSVIFTLAGIRAALLTVYLQFKDAFSVIPK